MYVYYYYMFLTFYACMYAMSVNEITNMEVSLSAFQ